MPSWRPSGSCTASPQRAARCSAWSARCSPSARVGSGGTTRNRRLRCMTRTAARRRQRSVRVSVAVALLASGTLLTVGALAAGTVVALAVAATLATVCGWAAFRILHSELLEERHEHARARAAQADAFRALFTHRSHEHAAFVTAMGERLAAATREVRELEGTLWLSECRALEAEDRVRREARAGDQARARVAELEVALAIRSAEAADELAGWSADSADLDTVVDLLAWEERAQHPVVGSYGSPTSSGVVSRKSLSAR